MRILGLSSDGETKTNTLDISTFKIIHTCAKFTLPPTKKQPAIIIFQYATAACP